MRRSLRYLLAISIAGGITFGVAIEHDSVFLLLGTFVTYALTIGIWLRYPSLLRVRAAKKSGFNVASGVLAGGMTFGALMLAHGIGETPHLGAAVVGFGLALFGVISGVWMVDNGEITLRPSDADPDGTTPATTD